MITIPFDKFSTDEIEDFLSTCKKFKLNPNNFSVKAEQKEPELALYQEEKFVYVIYVPEAIIKKYFAGNGSNWTYQFEQDLKSGLFFKSPPHPPSSP